MVLLHRKVHRREPVGVHGQHVRSPGPLRQKARDHLQVPRSARLVQRGAAVRGVARQGPREEPREQQPREGVRLLLRREGQGLRRNRAVVWGLGEERREGLRAGVADGEGQRGVAIGAGEQGGGAVGEEGGEDGGAAAEGGGGVDGGGALAVGEVGEGAEGEEEGDDGEVASEGGDEEGRGAVRREGEVGGEEGRGCIGRRRRRRS